MDLFSLGFLLLILVASGFVAFVADRLGKKLGKKRLSIWGLRPKHVATLGTVVMGVLVSLLTIAFVAAASKDARTWLREGRQLLIQRDQLRKDNEEFKAENRQLAKESKELAQESHRLAESNGQLRGANANLQKTNQGLQEAIGGLKADLDAQRDQLAQAQSQRASLVADAKRLQGKIRELGASRSATLVALKTSRAELARTQAAVGSLQVKLAGVQKKIAAANAELKTSGLNLNDARNKLNEALLQKFELYKDLQRLQGDVDAAKAVIADLTAQRVTTEGALKTAQDQYKSTQAQLEDAKQELVRVQSVVDVMQGFLNSGYKSSRTESMTFRAREEIARFVVPGGADASTARAALTSLIRLARLEAADRGAKGGKSNGQTFEVADIFDRQDPKSGSSISSEELKSAVVTRVAGRVEDQVLIATSSLNAFAGEPVSLDIAVLPNPVIYHQGEMLSEARIDGSLAEDRIFGQISDFVRSRVRERAVQDRMIPRSGTDAPFGEVPMSDMFALVGQIKRVGRSVRLQAIAGEDIHAADPLRLEFRLK